MYEMVKLLTITFFYFFLSYAYALEPSSGIVCKNLNSNFSVEFLFKKDGNGKFEKAFKRVDGEFREIGNIVGKKLSSFILFEDKTVLKHLDFAWHLDEVTKNLKPFILSDFILEDIEMPMELSCISKNFWY